MEAYITLSFLNDFIFCPRSIYFHQLYGSFDHSLYKQAPQYRGTAAHTTVDEKRYSTSAHVLMGREVFAEKYNICGKIDVFDVKKGKLIERKRAINTIYDGYVFQVYAQCFGLRDAGYEVREIVIHDLCHRILALWVVGHGSVSSGLMERSRKFAFPIYWLSFNFKMIGHWNSPTEGNFLLRKKQYQYTDWALAKYLVVGKINNQMALLKSIRKKSLGCKEAIVLLEQYREQLDAADTLTEILGIEGISSKVYFQNWFDTLPWTGRKPRVKHDIINVLLDIGYTFLFYMVENMLHLYGFDVYQGVYHRNFYKRKSLACDLQEPFRCIIDKQVKKAFALGQVRQEDFTFEKGQYRLQATKSKEYTRWLLSSILEHKADIFLYCQQYYRCFVRSKPVSEFPVFNL